MNYQGGDMSTPSNEAIYRRLIEEAFNGGNLEVADELVAPGALEHQRGGGTNLGTFAGRPPTGKQAFIDVIDIARFEDGKMVEHWGVPDQLGMMKALGLIQ
ncbi:MAG TPA: ester cyclase [Candidatus Dormibacteraeota bacterium]|nr:ester cyclase [Candidatus Dormibacteraeota bacterium]